MKRMNHPSQRRRGAIVVLTAIMLAFMLALIALAIDIGYLLVAKTELQHAADAAALAAAADLVPDSGGLIGQPDMSDEITTARNRAVQFAAANRVRNVAPGVDLNNSNSASGDIVIGYLANPSDPTQNMSFADLNKANAAQVRVRRTAAKNGEVALFFSRIFGINGRAVEATATAALRTESFAGFRTPVDGTNLPILPITLKLDAWNDMLNGNGPDDLGWSPNKGLTHKGDNVLEIELYPDSTTPGNFGTIDIGYAGNSTSDIARQIVSGVNADDMAQMPGGKLAFDADGLLSLNGDTGVSASIQNELKSIIGQPRMIPIYNSVSGSGDTANYNICAFVGVRVMAVKLTGSLALKSVTIQPAYVAMKGGIGGGGEQTSQYVYSYSVWLVR